MGSRTSDVAEEQPRLNIEHRVLVMASALRYGSDTDRIERLLDGFYAENGPGWELINVFKLGAMEFPSSQAELMFVFQRRSYADPVR